MHLDVNLKHGAFIVLKTTKENCVPALQSVQFSVRATKLNAPMGLTQGNVRVKIYAYQKEKMAMEIRVKEIAQLHVQDLKHFVKVARCLMVAKEKVIALKSE